MRSFVIETEDARKRRPKKNRDPLAIPSSRLIEVEPVEPTRGLCARRGRHAPAWRARRDRSPTVARRAAVAQGTCSTPVRRVRPWRCWFSRGCRSWRGTSTSRSARRPRRAPGPSWKARRAPHPTRASRSSRTPRSRTSRRTARSPRKARGRSRRSSAYRTRTSTARSAWRCSQATRARAVPGRPAGRRLAHRGRRDVRRHRAEVRAHLPVALSARRARRRAYIVRNTSEEKVLVRAREPPRGVRVARRVVSRDSRQARVAVRGLELPRARGGRARRRERHGARRDPKSPATRDAWAFADALGRKRIGELAAAARARHAPAPAQSFVRARVVRRGALRARDSAAHAAHSRGGVPGLPLGRQRGAFAARGTRALVLAGHDHDRCAARHEIPEAESGAGTGSGDGDAAGDATDRRSDDPKAAARATVTELTLGTFSWLMGNPKPSACLMTFSTAARRWGKKRPTRRRGDMRSPGTSRRRVVFTRTWVGYRHSCFSSGHPSASPRRSCAAGRADRQARGDYAGFLSIAQGRVRCCPVAHAGPASWPPLWRHCGPFFVALALVLGESPAERCGTARARARRISESVEWSRRLLF